VRIAEVKNKNKNDISKNVNVPKNRSTRSSGGLSIDGEGAWHKVSAAARGAAAGSGCIG
jgi:hypothetical protein